MDWKEHSDYICRSVSAGFAWSRDKKNKKWIVFLKTTTYDYDPAGNLLTVTDPNSNKTAYVYDDVNRRITMVHQKNHQATETPDTSSPPENKYTYGRETREKVEFVKTAINP